MSTLFQDSAGTTPVTALEQPVGRMLDKSGRGNHALQATTTKRPVLSRRVNLLNKTAAGAPWGSCVKTEISNYFGEDVGFSLYQDGVYYSDSPNLTGTVSVSAGAKLTATVLIDMSTVTGRAVLVGLLCFYQGGGVGWARAVLTKAGVVSVNYVADMTEVEVAGVLLYGSVYRIAVSARLSKASANIRIYCEAANRASAVWGRPQITLATDAHLPYQRVNTATDYDADPSKFPAYLRFDGVDDAMVTVGNIDFTGTDKMTVWTGSLNTGATGYHLLYEFGRPASGDVGTFSHFAALDAVGRVAILSKAGASEGRGRFIPVVPPVLDITSYALDASKSVPTEAMPVLRKNGQSVGISYTGTFSTAPGWGNHPLYIGARAGTPLYFNGRLYSLIVRGAQTPLSQIEATEAYIKQKMRLP